MHSSLLSMLTSVMDAEGVQIYIEIVDEDKIIEPTNLNDLIDRFSINVTQSVGTATRETYTGIFRYADVDISLTLECAEYYYDANCDRFCNESCTCGPGLTGPFCTESIDDCVGVTCEVNQRCVDGYLSFSCECEPGYTGPNCLVDIDECAGVNCNSGICENEINSFMCECLPGYTGQFCEREVDKYKVQVTIHSVNNPDGRCAGCLDNECCEGQCPSRFCHYYFSYCLRPLGSEVSYDCAINKGDCNALEILPEMFFTNTTFTFSKARSVLNLTGTQLVS